MNEFEGHVVDMSEFMEDDDHSFMMQKEDEDEYYTKILKDGRIVCACSNCMTCLGLSWDLFI